MTHRRRSASRSCGAALALVLLGGCYESHLGCWDDDAGAGRWDAFEPCSVRPGAATLAWGGETFVLRSFAAMGADGRIRFLAYAETADVELRECGWAAAAGSPGPYEVRVTGVDIPPDGCGGFRSAPPGVSGYSCVTESGAGMLSDCYPARHVAARIQGDPETLCVRVHEIVDGRELRMELHAPLVRCGM